MLVHLPVMKKYPTYIAVLKDIIKNWRGTHSATIEKILPDITKYADILEVDENILWDRLSQLENPTLDLKDVPKFLPLVTLISAKKSRTVLNELKIIFPIYLMKIGKDACQIMNLME